MLNIQLGLACELLLCKKILDVSMSIFLYCIAISYPNVSKKGDNGNFCCARGTICSSRSNHIHNTHGICKQFPRT